MISVKDLKEWLDELNPETFVAVDEGGLTLVQILPGHSGLSGNYLEVGGIPDSDPMWEGEQA